MSLSEHAEDAEKKISRYIIGVKALPFLRDEIRIGDAIISSSVDVW